MSTGRFELDNLNTEPLALAYEVCAREAKTLTKITTATWEWVPEDSKGFAGPISLQNIVMARSLEEGLEICRATYVIGGDEELAVNVKAGDPMDEFSEFYLQKFGSIYRRHFYDICLRGIRLKRIEEKRRDGIRKRQAMARDTMVVRDKRHAATLQHAGN